MSLAPEYKPASQELSRLTYTASNKPGKLNPLGEELEKRARKESLKAGFNLRSRAYVPSLPLSHVAEESERAA